MAGTFGGYWQSQILNSLVNNTTLTHTQTMWVALGTSAVFTAGGTNTFEPFTAASAAGAGYARYGIGTGSCFEAVTVPTAGSLSGAVATNTATLTISAGTTSSWGDIGWIAIMNTTTVGTGDVLAWCTAAATRTVSTGDQVLIAAGSLSIQVGP